MPLKKGRSLDAHRSRPRSATLPSGARNEATRAGTSLEPLGPFGAVLGSKRRETERLLKTIEHQTIYLAG
eukprot:8981265-Pyramimonas_sp.AAC.1